MCVSAKLYLTVWYLEVVCLTLLPSCHTAYVQREHVYTNTHVCNPHIHSCTVVHVPAQITTVLFSEWPGTNDCCALLRQKHNDIWNTRRMLLLSLTAHRPPLVLQLLQTKTSRPMCRLGKGNNVDIMLLTAYKEGTHNGVQVNSRWLVLLLFF